jgi:hypothetical protein
MKNQITHIALDFLIGTAICLAFAMTANVIAPDSPLPVTAASERDSY